MLFIGRGRFVKVGVKFLLPLLASHPWCPLKGRSGGDTSPSLGLLKPQPPEDSNGYIACKNVPNFD